jgi:hypothetical protein
LSIFCSFCGVYTFYSTKIIVILSTHDISSFQLVYPLLYFTFDREREAIIHFPFINGGFEHGEQEERKKRRNKSLDSDKNI